ncbi:beta-lactamase-like protein [Cristinia sonorae]|uniref:Beta-lactamase-like protein n=1 Tax=Cristinia sonorae TaxID=1940300 RepID=A0A8K0XM03_9AGAR|nr:beta-lactamase-like protein [Cristinia sonorae]
MPPTMSVTFLGTSSGGGPIESRNCSSLVLDVLGDNSLWMVDCAEGTVRQFASQPSRYGDKYYRRAGKVSKIFITHMHADHTMGIITLLRDALGYPRPDSENALVDPPPKIEVYGPQGIRQFIRSIFTITHSRTADKYAVYELLSPGESASAPIAGSPDEPMHPSEVPGADLVPDAEGYWKGITRERMGQGFSDCSVVVDAGPIIHRDPCIGYVVKEILPETTPLVASRTLVVLGDTSDPKELIPLIKEPPVVPLVSTTTVATISHPTQTSSYASVTNSGVVFESPVPSKVALLIHECTDCYIPPEIDTRQRTGKNRRPDVVLEKMLQKGHSVATMAGAFAREIDAEKLVLNHIGSRFPAPPALSPIHSSGLHRFQHECIEEIERQAFEAFRPPSNERCVIAAYDFLTVEVPPLYRGLKTARKSGDMDDDEGGDEAVSQQPGNQAPGRYYGFRGGSSSGGGATGDGRRGIGSGAGTGRGRGRGWDTGREGSGGRGRGVIGGHSRGRARVNSGEPRDGPSKRARW